MVLLDRSAKQITIVNKLSGGRRETYDILAEFPFDSTRKRMSLLVRHAG